MTRKKLTQKDIDWMAHKREVEGKSIPWIAEKLGVSVPTINYHCQQVGAVPPKGLRPRLRSGPSRGKPTTEKERQDFIALSNAGLSPHAIGKQMNRPANTVRYWLGRIALEQEQEERQIDRLGSAEPALAAIH